MYFNVYMPSTNTKPPGISPKDVSPAHNNPPEMETQIPEITPEIQSTEQLRETEQTPQEISVKEDSKFLDDAIKNLKDNLKHTKRKPTQVPEVRDEITIKVEKIMEEGLADAFKEMTPIQKQEFKIHGERTAIEIRKLLKSSKIKIKKIFQLLLEWLRLLPGVNRFFLEQEAKIKADKIISLKKINDGL